MCWHSDMPRKLQGYTVGLAVFVLSLSTCAQTPVHPDVERKVEAILSQLTSEEKIDLLGGMHFFDVGGVPRLGLPLLHTADGPFGVRNNGPATVMAGGIALAATWNPALAERMGTQLGRDARAKGKHFLLGPGVNIYRSPLNGRNFEYFGEDPWLAARMAVAYVQGVQSQGVCATIKHFLGNNSEFGRHTTDSIIDQRTEREIYLPAFEAAVKNAQVCAIMDSYNLTNGAHMTQNGVLNNDIVKKEWRFRGIIMSDWDATYDTIGAANGGLDLEMPSGKFLNRQGLLPAIRTGTVTQASIDDKVRRLLREELRFGWPDRPAIDVSVPRYNQPGREVACAAAREGMVLLKNEGGLLPLDKKTIRTIAVIGPNAYPAVPVGGGSAQAAPFHGVSFLEGLSNYLGTTASVYSHPGIPSLSKVAADTTFSTAPVNGSPGLNVEVYDNQNLAGSPATRTDEHLSFGTPLDMNVISAEDFDPSTLASGHQVSLRWTGFYTPSAAGDYDLIVQQGGFGDSGYRLYLDDKLVRDSWNLTKAVVEDTRVSLGVAPHKVRLEYRSDGGLGGPFVRMGVVRRGEWVEGNAEQIARKADVVILAVGFDPASETEGWDRSFSLPPGQEELIERIAGVNKNTVVVITSGGGVDMGAWIDQVPGLIEAWYPGQEGGTALADILFGEVNPSGRLPVTFERRWEDNPSHDHYYPAAGTNRIPYDEGVFVGYRGYQRHHTQPLFPFGFGLSYRMFRFSALEVSPAKDIPAATSASGPLFEVAYSVSNSGSRPGAAVAEIYVADEHASVPRPPKELKGFVKSDLKPGETRRVSVPLDARSLSFYDVKTQKWRAEAGTFKVMVGSSSENIELSGELKLNDTIVTAP
jgi:beta-glucosidase